MTLNHRQKLALEGLAVVVILVLAGGPDFWSNGLNLNVIEAA